jgi:hypothetical protein
MDVYASIVIWSLIVYRISDDIAILDGPFKIFSYIRGLSYHKLVPVWISNGLHCPICISWWLSLALVGYFGDIRYFAAAGITTLFVRFTMRYDE